MARITAGITSSHVPAVGAALDLGRTADPYWQSQAVRAFEWFLGWNDLGLELYSPNSGGCYDALHVDRVNQNQGAESTLAFLLSLAEMKFVQNSLSSFATTSPLIADALAIQD